MKRVKVSDLVQELKVSLEEFTQKATVLGVKIPPKVKTITEEEAQVIRNQLQKKNVSLTEVRVGDVLEKRVQTSVIRRRKVEKEEPKKEEKLKTEEKPAVIEKEILSQVKDEKSKELSSKEEIPKEKVAEVKPSVSSAEKEPKVSKKEGQQVESEEELAKKRRKAFIKRRSEEFDIRVFNREERIYQAKKKKTLDRSRMQSTLITVPKESKRVIKMSGTISIDSLAEQLKIKANQVIKKLMSMGITATLNQAIDADTATLIAHEYQHEVQNQILTEEDLLKREKPKDEDLRIRPPVVTIMGHVDHGKTTLLDAIRQANVAAQEAGGITQHIGAYMVELDKSRRITFIDTPGHEAFSAMRARGANTTDIVILVVAADDGVMPQTKEAVAHAKQAQVPLIVAINKIDKPGINLDRVKKQLSEMDLLVEEWGGKTICAGVSAKEKKGIKELLELILLQADVLELKASSNTLAQGIVLEAKIAKGLGPVATVLVQEGILVKGDILVSGTTLGKVRLILDHQGKQLKEALPSYAVEVSSLDSVPSAGDHFYCFKKEADAKALVEWRKNKEQRTPTFSSAAPPSSPSLTGLPNSKEEKKMTLEGLYAKLEEGKLEELKMIVKADVQGSQEVIKQTIEKLSSDKVKMNVIYTAVGGISESDVNLAFVSNAVIIGFNVRPDSKADQAAKSQKVEIKLYSIIYDVIEDLKKAMLGKLEPVLKEMSLGKVQVRNVFKISKVGTIAGCSVIEGKITRTSRVRLIRDQAVIYTGKISSLKRFKDDAREVTQGYECGLGIENYNDLKEGDIIEAFVVEEVRPT